MYQNKAQNLSTDECYPDSVMEEFKNFSATLDNLMLYYKLILPVLNSFSGDTEKCYPQIYKLYSQAENFKNLSHDCSLILSFDVVNQILAQLTGAKFTLTSQQLLQRKILQLFCIFRYLLGMYLGHFTDGCVLRNAITNNNAYHF